MIVCGSFTVKCDSEKAFEVLVGALGELKAKMNDIDTLRYKIDGKSKTTALKWGTDFHARVIKHFADTMVEIYDLGLVNDDVFIKKLYNKFTKYQTASPLEVRAVKQINDFKSEVDERLDDTPVPSGGAPALMAGIPGETGPGALPANQVCRRCGASNLPDSAFCIKCGHSLAACPSCGHTPEEGMSFCIKCGAKMG